MINNLGKQLTALCFLPSGKLVCYKQGFILLMQNDEVISKFPISLSFKEKILGKSNYLHRLLRLGIRAAEAIDETHIVYSKGNMLYEMDLTNGDISEGFYCGPGIRPLIFTKVKGIANIEDGLYFGGYLGNRTKLPVDIFKRISKDRWESIYTFPNGMINHVHNIVPDSHRQCLWIFTGDFDEASAIWKVTDHFKQVERIVCNDQKYRGCVAFALKEGLLYATDAPFADDFIYLMNPDTYEIKKIAPIEGSCIYGCQWKENYVFSSTVEGDGRNTSRTQFYFGHKRGAGIKDEYVHLYCGNLRNGFNEIYKEKKDCMPLYTFQFGVFKFPYGINNSDTLFFQPIATNKNDLNLLAFKE